MRNARKATDKWRHDAGYAFTLKTPYNDKTSPRGNIGLSLSGRFERVAPAGSASRLQEVNNKQ